MPHKESACPLLNAKGLEESLAHRRCLLNTCGLDKDVVSKD